MLLSSSNEIWDEFEFRKLYASQAFKTDKIESRYYLDRSDKIWTLNSLTRGKMIEPCDIWVTFRRVRTSLFPQQYYQ